MVKVFVYETVFLLLCVSAFCLDLSSRNIFVTVVFSDIQNQEKIFSVARSLDGESFLKDTKVPLAISLKDVLYMSKIDLKLIPEDVLCISFKEHKGKISILLSYQGFQQDFFLESKIMRRSTVNLSRKVKNFLEEFMYRYWVNSTDLILFEKKNPQGECLRKDLNAINFLADGTIGFERVISFSCGDILHDLLYEESVNTFFYLRDGRLIRRNGINLYDEYPISVLPEGYKIQSLFPSRRKGVFFIISSKNNFDTSSVFLYDSVKNSSSYIFSSELAIYTLSESPNGRFIAYGGFEKDQSRSNANKIHIWDTSLKKDLLSFDWVEGIHTLTSWVANDKLIFLAMSSKKNCVLNSFSLLQGQVQSFAIDGDCNDMISLKNSANNVLLNIDRFVVIKSNSTMDIVSKNFLVNYNLINSLISSEVTFAQNVDANFV